MAKRKKAKSPPVRTYEKALPRMARISKGELKLAKKSAGKVRAWLGKRNQSPPLITYESRPKLLAKLLGRYLLKQYGGSRRRMNRAMKRILDKLEGKS